MPGISFMPSRTVRSVAPARGSVAPMTADDPTGAAARTLRRDAQRNRERIVATARRLFAERGLTVGFNEIAHSAGVAVGTVYNRFVDKDELVRAALTEPADELLRVAEQARGADRAWDGVRLLLDGIAALLATNVALRDLALTLDDTTVPARGLAIAAIVDELLDRARAEGDLRAGVTVDDLVAVLWMVTEVARHSPDHPELYRRYLQVVVDGLAAGTAPLDVAAPPGATAAMSRHWASSRAPRTGATEHPAGTGEPIHHPPPA